MEISCIGPCNLPAHSWANVHALCFESFSAITAKTRRKTALFCSVLTLLSPGSLPKWPPPEPGIRIPKSCPRPAIHIALLQDPERSRDIRRPLPFGTCRDRKQSLHYRR